MKIHGKHFIKACLGTVMLFFCMTASAFAAEKEVLPTNVEEPTDGCLLVGLSGSYADDVKAALDQINAYRLEACKNGYLNPDDPGKKLTMDDYHEIKWSSDLEYIARIRAAEATFRMDHRRPNGDMCFTLKSPNGVGSYGEVLAWCGSRSILAGVKLWYSEKEYWVKDGANSAYETGHYTQMISPGNHYVGLAAFIPDSYGSFVTSSGEFSFESSLPSEPMAVKKDIIQVFETRTQLVATAGIAGKDFLAENAKTRLYLGYCNAPDFSEDTALFDMGKVTWASSDENIATVDEQGVVTGLTNGTVTITATNIYGTSASLTMHIGAKPADTLTITLNKTTVSYNGKAQKPKVTVMDGENKVSANNYTVTYEGGCKNVGKHKVVLTFKNEYKGKRTASFTIIPKTPVISSIKAEKKGFTVKWKKVTGCTTGYEVQYAKNPYFTSGRKTVKIKGNKTLSCTVENLKTHKYYFVRVRVYHKVSGKTYYSEWTREKRVLLK